MNGPDLTAHDVEGSTVIICHGPEKGRKARYRCGCCGDESNNIDWFAMSTCWMCAFGGNLDCANCRAMGVPVDKFSSKRGRSHRMREWEKGKRRVITCCGYAIPKHDIGQGVAVRETCRICWPEVDQ